MSRFGGRGSAKVGEARVDIVGDNSQLNASLDESKAKVRDFGDATEQSAGRAKGALDGVSDAVEGGTSAFRRFSGAITSSVGAITGLVGVSTLLIGSLKGIHDQLEERREARAAARRDLVGAAHELRELASGVNTTAAEITAALDAIQNRDAGERLKQLTQSERAFFLESERLAKEARVRIRALDDQDRDEAFSRAPELANRRAQIELDAKIAALDEELRASEEAELNKSLQAVAESDRRLRRIKALQDEARSEEEREELASIRRREFARLNAVLGRLEEERRAEVKRIEDKAQAEIDAIDKVAARMEEKFSEAIDRVLQGQNQLFGNDGAFGSSAILAQLRQIENSIPRNIPSRGAGEVY